MQLKLSFVAGLIAASALATAAPLEHQERGINIDIEKRANLKVAGTEQIDWAKVDAHMNSLRAKYQKSLANFEKNTGKVHPSKRDLPEHLVKRATGTVGLTDQQGGELWTGTMAYGTPAQSFQIDFDTGSSDTLVNNGVFKPSASSTSKTNGDTFQTSYGDGTTAQGTIYTDVVHIAGISASGTAIGVANGQFLDSSQGASGISGMALPQLAAFGSSYLPYFYSLKQAGAVTSGKFQFDLRTSGSSLFLGGTNSAKYSTTPAYVSVDSDQGFWQVPASVNGQSIQSIVDTGTTIIVAPTSQAQTLFTSLGLSTFQQSGSTYAYYNCNSPPKITFKYGSYSKTLSAATTSFGTTTSGQCVLSVAGSDLGINAWVTGDSWLQNTVAIFDTDNNRVGFANKA
ncbi:related to pepsin precursor (aspartate protease) [Melanopsichium pennsylvanicum]|uniref:Related to pepsin (Aspartate protease) n=2 Tax=Melanopsichium pennsylvanicum TaxID=63383 RepID=A0AAJ4XFD4_9BASI|nr:related to pepsin precursor (aspartate protease) [Melanopsichium pennsylvanicum 4]SNX81364.1 related to pepsin precursor (aspartate protease) [Melanopsichium pennsylvanicum]